MKLNVTREPKPKIPPIKVGQVFRQTNDYYTVIVRIGKFGDLTLLLFNEFGELCGHRTANKDDLPRKNWTYIGTTELPTLEITPA